MCISPPKISTLLSSELKNQTATIATPIPTPVDIRASAIPDATDPIPPEPEIAMLWKALMIPNTVPKRPINGEVDEIIDKTDK